VEKHKARFVARGFSQVEAINSDETFAHVARYSSIKSIMALSSHMGWKIHQMCCSAHRQPWVAYKTSASAHLDFSCLI